MLLNSDAVEDIDAHVVHGYIIHDNPTKSMVSLSYPLDDMGNILTGRSFHHGRFIMGLRKEAQKDGYGHKMIRGEKGMGEGGHGERGKGRDTRKQMAPSRCIPKHHTAGYLPLPTKKAMWD